MTDRIIREVSKTVSLKRKYYPLLILQFSFPVLFLFLYINLVSRDQLIQEGTG